MVSMAQQRKALNKGNKATDDRSPKPDTVAQGMAVKTPATPDVPAKVQVAVTNQTVAEYMRLGSKMSDTLVGHLNHLIKITDEKDYGFIDIVDDIRQSYSRDEINGMPQVGTQGPDVKGERPSPSGNNRPEWFKYDKVVDGKAVKPTVSAYRIMFEASKSGVPIITRLNQVNQAIADKSFLGLGKDECESIKRQLDGNTTNGVKQFRNAMEFVQQCQRIEDYPGATWKWIPDRNAAGELLKDAQGNVIPKKGPFPLAICDSADGTNTTGAISRTQFTGYDCAKGRETGGTYASLLKTASRVKSGASPTTLIIENMAQLDVVFSTLANAMDSGKIKESDIIKRVNEDPHFRKSFKQFMMSCDGAWTKVKDKLERVEVDEALKAPVKAA